MLLRSVQIPRLSIVALLLLSAASAAAGSLRGAVLDEGLSVALRHVAQIPASAGVAPLARINVLREAPDGSGRLFVNDLQGPLHVLDGERIQTYMDLSVAFPALKTAPGFASGFVSFALHPEFASNGLLYTVHCEFVGLVAPNLGPATLGEIYAYGFRNGHRIAWDSAGTGALFVTDIGESNVEEVNIIAPGANYGWPIREGSFAVDVTVNRDQVFPLPPMDPVPLSYPVVQYDHEEGLAIAGGIAYRRPGSALSDKFIFGDIVSGRMFYSDMAQLLASDDGDPATTAPVYELHLRHQGEDKSLLQVVRDTLADPGIKRTDLRLGQDLSGRIYVSTKQDGVVRELVPARGRLSYIYLMNGDPIGVGNAILYDGGRFEDEASGTGAGPDLGNGAWLQSADARTVLLNYDDGVGCGAVMLGRIDGQGRVWGLRWCMDGTPGLGIFVGTLSN